MQLLALVDQYEDYMQSYEELCNKRSEQCGDLTHINSKISDVEDLIEDVEDDIYTESTTHYFATLSKKSDRVALTYHFTSDIHEEIKIQFKFSGKDGFYFKSQINDGTASFLDKIEVIKLLEEPNSIANQEKKTSGVMGWISDVAGLNQQLLLKHGLSTDISLTDFLSSVCEDFCLNYKSYITKLNLTNSLLDMEAEAIITKNLKAQIDTLNNSLKGNTSKNQNILYESFDTFNTETYHLENLFSFSKDKEKDYLYTDLNNQLSDSKTPNIQHKI